MFVVSETRTVWSGRLNQSLGSDLAFVVTNKSGNSLYNAWFCFDVWGSDFSIVNDHAQTVVRGVKKENTLTPAADVPSPEGTGRKGALEWEYFQNGSWIRQGDANYPPLMVPKGSSVVFRLAVPYALANKGYGAGPYVGQYAVWYNGYPGQGGEKNASGLMKFPIEITDNIAPPTIEKVGIVGGENDITMAWNPISQVLNGSPIQRDLMGYYVYRANASAGPWTSASIIGYIDARKSHLPAYSDADVIVNQTYYYRIGVVDSGNNISPLSPLVSARRLGSPCLRVAPTYSRREIPYGQTDEVLLTCAIQNMGARTINWSAVILQGTATLNPASGTAASGMNPSELELHINPSVLAVGNNRFLIKVNGVDPQGGAVVASPQTVTVDVGRATAGFVQVTPETRTTNLIGGAGEKNVTGSFMLTNIGKSPMKWSVAGEANGAKGSPVYTPSSGALAAGSSINIAYSVFVPLTVFPNTIYFNSGITGDFANTPISQLVMINVQTPPPSTLTVASQHGSPTPPVGANSVVWGDLVRASVETPSDDNGNGLRYRCIGWTGSGSVPASGTSSSFDFTITRNSSVTWKWVEQYQITPQTSANGGLWPSEASWCDSGTSMTFTAIPFDGYQVNQWMVNGIAVAGAVATLTVPANAPKTVSVAFVPINTPTRLMTLAGDLNFGSVRVGQTAQRIMTISNKGNLDLYVSSIDYPNGFKGTWSGAIHPNSSQNVAIEFAPTADISYGGVVIVNSDKTGGNNVIAITGIGALPLLPLPPTDVSASDGSYTDKVEVTWNASFNATSYEVWRYTGDNTNLAVRIAANLTVLRYDDRATPLGQTNYYWVKARNADDVSDFSAPNTGYRAASVLMPTGVSASDGLYTNKVEVKWNASSNATAYEVWRYTNNNSSWAVRLVDNLVATRYDDFGTAAGQTNYYWVKAKNAAGVSGFSVSDSGYRGVLAAQFAENWENGLDAGLWKSWGSPSPVIRAGEGRNGTKGYDANGDGWYQSGSTTYRTFDLSRRPTLVFWAKGRGTSEHWQNMIVGWSSTNANGYGGSDGQPSELIYVYIAPESTDHGISYVVPGAGYTEPWVNSAYDEVWMEYRVSINADNTVSFYRDGVLRWTSPAVTNLARYTAQSLVADGRSYSTHQIIDDLVVYDKGGTPVPQPPIPPIGVAASDGSYTDRVQVTWNVSSGATAYEVWRCASNNVNPAIQITNNLTATRYDDFGTAAGRTNYYWVKAKNAVGVSGFSVPDAGYRAIPLPAPTGLSASDGTFADKVRLTWNASAGATAYEVWIVLPTPTCLSSNVSGALYDHTTASPGVEYWYTVRAKNALGLSAFSEHDKGYRLALPASPTGVAASDGLYTNKVEVTWNASSNATTYEVWRCASNNVNLAIQITNNLAAIRYDDFGTAAGQTNYYWVKAKNAAGASGFSAADNGYRSALPILFVEDWENGINTNRWKLWGAPLPVIRDGEGRNGSKGFDANGDQTGSSGATTYRTFDLTQCPILEFRARGHSSFANGQTIDVGWSCTNADRYGDGTQPDNRIGVYIVPQDSIKRIFYYVLGGMSGAFSEYWTNSTHNDVWMTYRVSINADRTVSFYRDGKLRWTSLVVDQLAGYKGQSLVLSGSSYQDHQLVDDVVVYKGTGTISLPQPPLPPTGLWASSGNYADRVSLSWNASERATAYEVWTVSPTTVCLADNELTTGYKHTSATPGVTYTYKMKAKNAAGVSDFSLPVTGYRQLPPDAPTGLSASKGTFTDKVRLTWNASPRAAAYEVWTVAPTPLCLSDNVSAASYDHTAAAAGVEYWYVVRAKNAAGVSPFSEHDKGYRLAIPAPPTELSASDGEYVDKIQLTWKTSLGATAYEVWTTVPSLTCLAANVTVNNYAHTSATPGVSYWYQVRAKNALGVSQPSEQDMGYRPVAPMPPANLRASDGMFTDKVQLMWNLSSGATGYEVWRAAVNNVNQAVPIANNVTLTRYEDFNVPVGQTNYYWVKAKNIAGAGGFSLSDGGYRSALPVLFAEDWENGIDAGLWKLWGSPLPVAREGEGRNGSNGFDANGDQSSTSGATTYRTFDLTQYPILEFRAKGHSSLAYWQTIDVGWSCTNANSYGGDTGQPDNRIGVYIVPKIPLKKSSTMC